MMYAIRYGCSAYPGSLVEYDIDRTLFPVGPSNVDKATLFDTQQDAIGAIVDIEKRAPSSSRHLHLVAVEEIPGETKREVVELTGVVDLTGLKFAARERGTSSYIVREDGCIYGYGHIKNAILFDTAADLAVWFGDCGFNYRMYPGCPEIVGIREVTTAPTRRIVELVPAEPWPDFIVDE